jgi:uncharacterized oxidoreductase
MELTKNTILITGGATGIGYAFAEQFIKLGNTVIICGRREHRLKEAKEKLPALHIRVCDVSKSDQRIKLAEWVIQNFPQMNVLINNAGMQHNFNLKQPIEINDARLETATNFIGPIHLSSLFVEHLKKQKDAAIINVSSGLAFTPLAFMPVYCATKAALHSFTLSLRHQLSSTSVKVYEILPPMVDTELDGGDRNNREHSERGMNAGVFASLALEALKNDVLEAAIGSAENLRAKREGLFNMLNH